MQHLSNSNSICGSSMSLVLTIPAEIEDKIPLTILATKRLLPYGVPRTIKPSEDLMISDGKKCFRCPKTTHLVRLRRIPNSGPFSFIRFQALSKFSAEPSKWPSSRYQRLSLRPKSVVSSSSVNSLKKKSQWAALLNPRRGQNKIVRMTNA